MTRPCHHCRALRRIEWNRVPDWAGPPVTQRSEPLSLPVLKRVIAKARLDSELRDDGLLVILEDLGRLMAQSERRCEHAARHNDQELAEHVIDDEVGYIEELIGSAFLLLQTKIRRVIEVAKSLEAALRGAGRDQTAELASDHDIRAVQGNFGATTKSLVALIWAVANYYKHRDEWPVEAWRDRRPDEAIDRRFERDRRTRRTVQLLGVERAGNGNMRRCLEFLGVHPYSDCSKLGQQVQSWAADVAAIAERAVAATKAGADG